MKTVQKHSPEAQKVLRELEQDLAASGKRAGQELVWSAGERAVVEMVATAIDRSVDLAAEYQQAEDTKSRVKLSAELRLTEQAIARLLRQVQTDVAQPMSQRSLKAQRAARVRWDRDSGTG